VNRVEYTIRRLNTEYIRAFLENDVDWYDGHLADDFTFINRVGAIIDRPAFLRLAAAPPGVVDYELHEVTVRIRDHTAFVQARGVFTRADGTQGQNRYTDVYSAATATGRRFRHKSPRSSRRPKRRGSGGNRPGAPCYASASAVEP
jgi:hypothetical protein